MTFLESMAHISNDLNDTYEMLEKTELFFNLSESVLDEHTYLDTLMQQEERKDRDKKLNGKIDGKLESVLKALDRLIDKAVTNIEDIYKRLREFLNTPSISKLFNTLDELRNDSYKFKDVKISLPNIRYQVYFIDKLIDRLLTKITDYKYHEEQTLKYVDNVDTSKEVYHEALKKLKEIKQSLTFSDTVAMYQELCKDYLNDNKVEEAIEHLREASMSNSPNKRNDVEGFNISGVSNASNARVKDTIEIFKKYNSFIIELETDKAHLISQYIRDLFSTLKSVVAGNRPINTVDNDDHELYNISDDRLEALAGEIIDGNINKYDSLSFVDTMKNVFGESSEDKVDPHEFAVNTFTDLLMENLNLGGGDYE